MKTPIALILAVLLPVLTFAQTEDAYATSEESSGGALLDPSRFTIHHAVGFGMSSSSNSSVKSQSLYSTMMQYRFAAPVTLDLNFSLPIHSTYSSARNLTTDNVKSLEYFKSMPFDVSLTWQPRENLLMRFSVSRQSLEDYYHGMRGSSLFYDAFGEPIRF